MKFPYVTTLINGKIFNSSLFCSFLSFFLLPTQALLQPFADSNFYLVDGLVLNELNDADRYMVDSCLTFYHETEQDTNKVKALAKICETMSHESWGKYAHIQVKLCQKRLTKNHSIRAKTFLKRYLAFALSDVGTFYVHQDQSLIAKSYFERGLLLCNEINEYKGMSIILNNLGHIYSIQGNLRKAALYFYKNLKISKIINDEECMALTYNHLGSIYQDQNMRDKAITFYKNGLRIRKKIKDKPGIARIINNLGSNYSAKGDTSKAINYYLKSLKLYKDINDKEGISISSSNIGSIFSKLGLYDKAQKYLFNGILVAKEIGNQALVAQNNIYIGQLHIRKKEPKRAMVHAQNALVLSRKIGSPEILRDASRLLSEVYEKLGNTEEALEMYKLHVLMKDTILNSETQKLIDGLEGKYQYQLQQRQINLLKKDGEIKDKNLRFSIFLYSTISLLLIIAMVLLVRYRNRRFERELNTLRALKLEENEKKSEMTINSIQVNFGRKIITINFEEINFFKARGDYVFLFTRVGKSYVVDHKLKSLEKSLPINFVRIHRSSIINRDMIKEISKTKRGTVVFTMKDNSSSRINSSRGYVEQVKNIIDSFGLV